MPRLRSFHLDRSSMGTQRLLFIAMYAVLSAGISSSVFFIFSSLRHDRAVDPDPLPQLVSTLSSSADRFRFGISDAWTRDIFDPPPTQEGMPPLEAFKLTKDLVASRAKDNVIVVTYGNHAFMDMIINWVRHLVAKGVRNIIVGAMDTKLLEALYWKGVPVFDMGTNTAGLDLEWGSREFHKRGRDVVDLLITILPFGFEVLLCDSDTVWLKVHDFDLFYLPSVAIKVFVPMFFSLVFVCVILAYIT